MFIKLEAAKELLSQIKEKELTDHDVIGLGVLKLTLERHIRNQTATFKINEKAFKATTLALANKETVPVKKVKKVVEKKEIATPAPVKKESKPKVPTTPTARVKVTQARKATQKVRQPKIGSPATRKK